MTPQISPRLMAMFRVRQNARARILATFAERMLSVVRAHVGGCPPCSARCVEEMSLLVSEIDAQLATECVASRS